jgi:hypothetical protein
MRLAIVFLCAITIGFGWSQEKSTVDRQLLSKRKELTVIGPELVRVFLGGEAAPLTAWEKDYLDRDFLLSPEIWYDEPIGEDVDAWLYRRHAVNCRLLTELVRGDPFPQGLDFFAGNLMVHGQHFPNLIPIWTLLAFLPEEFADLEWELWERGFPKEEMEIVHLYMMGGKSQNNFVPKRAAEVKTKVDSILAKKNKDSDDSAYAHLLHAVNEWSFHQWTASFLAALSPKARRIILSFAKEKETRVLWAGYPVDGTIADQRLKPTSF